MLNNDFITNLFNLQHVSTTNFVEDDSSITIFVSSTAPRPRCPHCNKPFRIHDYRTHKINFGSFNGKSLFIILRKRRFVCPCSNYIITETVNFVIEFLSPFSLISFLLLNFPFLCLLLLSCSMSLFLLF